ncbi:MAG: site-specific integrase [Tannerella sp.]|jgi:integrase|nr:site-specific integrase [Tannerella sp.]
MASIKTKLDRRRANERGEFPAKIVICNNQTNAALSLNFHLPEKAWEKDGLRRPVKSSYPGAKSINNRIEERYAEALNVIIDLERQGRLPSMKAADIKNCVMNRNMPADRADITFNACAGQYADGCKSRGTGNNYRYTVKRLNDFAGRELSFEEINFSFLRKFDDFLEEGGASVNTRSIHFRNIRAVFNRAIDDEIIGQNLYPFRKFKIKSEQKNKESLTAKQVKMLYEYDFKTKSLRMARDYWMLSFFLCGINPVDLYFLKKADRNGRVSFVRTKTRHNTHDVIKLFIQPEAQIIADRYSADPDSEYLLGFEGRYVEYSTFKRFLSKKIKEVSEITGLSGLTMYWARYSWATIADGIGIPEKTISKGLGHVDKSLAGRTYISFDWSKVDRANREVINFVMNGR